MAVPRCYCEGVELTQTIADARREDVARLGLATTALFWAAAFIAGKVVLAEMTPLTVAAWRFVIAGGVLFPLAVRQFPGWKALKASARPLALMTLCGGILYPWVFLAALSRTSAANTSLLIAMNPVFTLCLSVFVGERLSRRNVVGALLALTGAAMVITRGDWAAITQLTAFNSGDLLALSAAFCWACFNLASRGVAVRLPHGFVNGLVYGIGGVALCLMARNEAPVEQLLATTPAALACLTFMAIVSSVVAGLLFLQGVRVLGVNRTVIFIYLVPALTAVLSLVLLGEPLQPSQIIGGALALSGVYWATRPAVRRFQAAGVSD
jgi:drug/metabolite transporter (DMT)-like permease